MKVNNNYQTQTVQVFLYCNKVVYTNELQMISDSQDVTKNFS